MLQYAVAYAATAVSFVAIDYVWLNYIAVNFYRPRLGDILLESPNIPVAAAFYLLYCVATVVLVVIPAADNSSLLMAVGFGALFGLAAYGTYDITNLVTIKGWSLTVTAVDIAWGMLITATSATIGYTFVIATRAAN
jgi:uncharacterized membrane protein